MLFVVYSRIRQEGLGHLATERPYSLNDYLHIATRIESLTGLYVTVRPEKGKVVMYIRKLKSGKWYVEINKKVFPFLLLFMKKI